MRISLLALLIFLLLGSAFSAYLPEEPSYYWEHPYDTYGWKYAIYIGSEYMVNPKIIPETITPFPSYTFPPENFLREKFQPYIDAASSYSTKSLEYLEVCESFFDFNEDGSWRASAEILGPLKAEVRGNPSRFYGNSKIEDLTGLKVERDKEEYTVKEGNETRTKTRYRYYIGSESDPIYIPLPEITSYSAAIMAVLGDPASFLVSLGLTLLGDWVVQNQVDDYAEACSMASSEYMSTWQEMESALSVAFQEVNNASSVLKDIYDNVSYAGMCNENYTGPGKDFCLSLEEELNSLNYSNSSYKRFNLLYYSLASAEKPNISTATEMLELAGNYSKLAYDYSQAHLQAMDDYEAELSSLLMDVQTNLLALGQQEELSNQHNLYLVDAYVLEGAASEAMTVQQKAQAVSNLIQEADQILSAVESMNNLKTRGYAYYSIEMLKDLKQRTSLGWDLVAEARRVVEELDAKTSTLLSNLKARGYEVSQYETALQEARLIPTLGDKYVAIKNVYSSLQLLSSEEPEMKEEYNTLKALVEDLILRAKEDGLSMNWEESMLSSIETSQDSYIKKHAALTQVKQSILDKAEARFSSLVDYRSEFYSLASLTGEDSLVREASSLEGNLFSSSSLDVLNGLGKLKELEDFYKEKISYLEQLIASKAELLKVDVDINKPLVKPDEMGTYEANIYLKNPFPYRFENVEVEVPLEGEFYTEEVEVDRGFIVSSGEGATWVIDYLEPYETLTGSVKKSGIFVSTLSSNKTAVAFGEEGTVEESYSLDVLLPVTLDVECEGDCSVYIDGKLKGGEGNYDVGRGMHTLKIKTKKKLLEVEENTGQCVESSSVCKKDVKLTALEDVDEVRINLDGVIEGQNTSIAVLDGLKEGETQTLNVVEGFDSVGAELSSVLEGISSLSVELSAEDNTTLREIRSLNISGLKTEALEKAKNLYEKLKKEEKRLLEKEERERELNEEIEKEKQMLSEAVKTESPLKEELEDRLSLLSSIDPEDYDSGWAKRYVSTTTSQIWKEYGSLKKSYLKSATEDKEVEKLFDEFESKFRAAKSSYDVVKLSEAANILKQIEGKVDSIKGNSTSIEREYNDRKTRLSSLLSSYTEMSKKAKEYGVEEFLPRTYTYFKDKLKLISSAKSLWQKEKMLKEEEKLEQEFEDALASLEEAAKKELSNVESLISSSGDDPSRYAKSLELARKAIDEGDYVKALAIAKQLKEGIGFIEKKEDNLLFYVVLAAVGIGAAVFLLKDKLFVKKELPKRKIKRYGED